MPVRISQIDEPESGQTTLRVEGSLRLTEAEMLEELCAEPHQRCLIVDLAGVTFLDQEGARVLRRLKAQPGIRFTGLQLFTARMIESPEE